MATNSNIGWTHHTFNPWRGCTKVSPGCQFCYAERQSKRNLKVFGEWGPRGTRVMASESAWREPLKWNRWAKNGTCYACAGRGYDKKLENATGTAPTPPCETCGGTGKALGGSPYRARVFCASLADVFEGPETVNVMSYAVIVDARARLFDLIAETPNLDWLLLTKRPENWRRATEEVVELGHAARFVSKGMEMARNWLNGTRPTNVWMGTSVENQLVADKRIPELLKIPAAVRFLSCEPLLGPVDLERFGHDEGFGSVYDHRGTYAFHQAVGFPPGSVKVKEGIDWVIAGGESGPHARPMHPDWARSLRDQCQSAGVPFFFKQHGEWREPLEGEAYDTSLGRAQRVPAFIMGTNGTVNCYHDERIQEPRVVLRIGKKNAGNLLDGVRYEEFPDVPQNL